MVKSGYTLVEILVVMAIMSIFGVMAIYGMRSTSNSQSVTDAQRNFISSLRATQNKVINGADGLSVQVFHVPADISLPTGVSVSPTVNICFNNPSLATSTCTNAPTITVLFSNGSTTRSVVIESSGVNISRIYAN